MDDFDLLSFKYNGQKWLLMITVCNVANNINIMLNNQYVSYVDFENSLNNLILTGTVRYTDEVGKLDKVLAESYVTCHIKFWKEKGENEDGNTNFKISSEEITFEHEFIVQNVSVLDRKKNKISYQLDLISQNWIKFNKKLKYTNYHKEKEPTTEILKKLLQQAGFNIDTKSFDENKSPVKIYYMTNVNDTIYPAMNYLLRRMYYDKEQSLEESIKFLTYDIIKDKIYLTNLQKDTTFLSEVMLPMSCFDNSIEDMASETNIQMASLNKVRRSDFFKTFEMHHIYKYDPEKNDIKDIKETELCPKAMTKWFETVFTDSSENHHDKMTVPIREVFVKEADRWENYWNNDINIYEEHLNSLLYNDSLVVSIDGSLIQNSGGLCGIKVDRDLAKLEKLDGEKKADLQWRFKKFEGLWMVARSRHIIYPNQRKYKTNLTLFRNYTPIVNHN